MRAARVCARSLNLLYEQTGSWLDPSLRGMLLRLTILILQRQQNLRKHAFELTHLVPKLDSLSGQIKVAFVTCFDLEATCQLTQIFLIF